MSCIVYAAASSSVPHLRLLMQCLCLLLHVMNVLQLLHAGAVSRLAVGDDELGALGLQLRGVERISSRLYCKVGGGALLLFSLQLSGD